VTNFRRETQLRGNKRRTARDCFGYIQFCSVCLRELVYQPDSLPQSELQESNILLLWRLTIGAPGATCVLPDKVWFQCIQTTGLQLVKDSGNKIETTLKFLHGRINSSSQVLSVFQLILSRVGVTYRRGFGLHGCIYCALHIHNSGLQVIQRYRWSPQFTVHRYTRMRFLSLHYSYPGNGFITVCHFTSHMKSSFHSLYSATAKSIQFEAQSRQAAVSNSTLFSAAPAEHLFINIAQTRPKTQPLLLRRRVYWSVA
jgi:hypothetical protein